MKISLLLSILLLFSMNLVGQESGQEVDSDSDFYGVWMAQDTAIIQMFGDEEAPMVSWLILDESSSYFSGYLDPEMGASIDIQFTYERSDNDFKCVFVGSNSLGYFMQHENDPFKFQLFVVMIDGERNLKLVNKYGTHLLVPYSL